MTNSYLTNKRCCPIGLNWDEKLWQCLPNQNRCQIYEDGTGLCVTCPSNYFLSSKHCCPPGTYWNKIIDKCDDPIEHCYAYSMTNENDLSTLRCKQCYDGYLPTNNQKFCCQTYSFFNDQRFCIDNKLMSNIYDFCIDWDETTLSCLKCSYGYYLSQQANSNYKLCCPLGMTVDES